MEQVANKNTNVKPQTNDHAAAKDAAKDAEFKAKKAAAAKAFNERQAEKKANLVKFSKELIAKNLLDKVSPECKKFFEDCANPTVQRSGNGSSFFNKVFGDAPKAGDKITLLDYMKKTLKAKADLDKAVKGWAEKGIVVEFKEDSANLLNSTYTVVKC